MSADVERIKKLVNNDLLVAAVEISSDSKKAPLLANEIDEVLAQFDSDDTSSPQSSLDEIDYAHFVIRVKRSALPLPKSSSVDQSAEEEVSFDKMVDETFQISEKLAENRATADTTANEFDPNFLLENASILEESGDYALARNIFHALIRKGVQLPKSLSGLARTYEKDGNLEKAVRYYREAIAYSSELPFYQALTAIQIRLGNDQEAAETIIHALGLPNLNEEQSFELHKSLGNCYSRLNEYPKAEHHYRRAYEIFPDSDVLQVNVGTLALQKGDMAAAIKHFEKALELNSQNEKAVSGLGLVALNSGELQKAHDYFARSLEINLNNIGSIFNLVKCAYELKHYTTASQILKKYISQNSVNLNILYSYAGILFHQGEYSAAMDEVQKILASNPSHSGAKELGDIIKTRLKTKERSNEQGQH